MELIPLKFSREKRGCAAILAFKFVHFHLKQDFYGQFKKGGTRRTRKPIYSPDRDRSTPLVSINDFMALPRLIQLPFTCLIHLISKTLESFLRLSVNLIGTFGRAPFRKKWLPVRCEALILGRGLVARFAVSATFDRGVLWVRTLWKSNSMVSNTLEIVYMTVQPFFPEETWTISTYTLQMTLYRNYPEWHQI